MLIHEKKMKTKLAMCALGMLLLGGACTSGADGSSGDVAGDTTVAATAAEYRQVGEAITPEGAVNLSQMLARLAANGKVENVKVTGEVAAVCQKKGCWMVITDGLDSVRVVFKDYGFFVPKDIDGRVVVARGVAYYDTLTVEQQRHYAQDRGASEAEIAAITDDIITPMFEADGVLIYAEE